MENTNRRNLVRPREYGLGDKAYIGCPETLTELKKPRGGSISYDQAEWNMLLQFY